MYKETYIIESSNYKEKEKLKMIVVSDLHYHKNVGKKLFLELINNCKTSKPKYIIMPGDMIETIDFITKDEERIFFEELLIKLSKIAPIIMVPGNHEKANFDLKMSRELNNEAINYFETLSKRKNIYFLNNKVLKLNGISFFGFDPSFETYVNKDKNKISEKFIKDYKLSEFKTNSNDYNILVTHSPRVIKYLKENDLFKNIDLVLTGHYHNGHLQKKQKSLNKKKVGIFLCPLSSPIPGEICRGIHKFGRGYLFISKGFRNLTADIWLFNLIEKISINEIEEIIVQNCKEGCNIVEDCC